MSTACTGRCTKGIQVFVHDTQVFVHVVAHAQERQRVKNNRRNDLSDKLGHSLP